MCEPAGTVVPAFTILTVGVILWRIQAKAIISPTFLKSFYNSMASNFGCTAKVIEPLVYAPEAFGILVGEFSAMVSVTVPFWPLIWHKEPVFFLFMSAVFLWAVSLLTALFMAGHAFLRQVQASLSFVASASMTFYGVLPVLILFVAGVDAAIILKHPAVNTRGGYVSAITAEILLFGFGAIFGSAWTVRDTVLSIVRGIEFWSLHPETLTHFGKLQLRAKSYLVFMLWLISAIGQSVSILICALLVGWSVNLCPVTSLPKMLGASVYILDNSCSYWFQYFALRDNPIHFLKCVMLLYCLPTFVLTVAFIGRNLVGMVRCIKEVLTRNDAVGGEFSRAADAIKNISEFAMVKPPFFRMVDTEAIHARVEIPFIPGFRPALVLSTGAVKRLSAEQLEAILAHEIGHISKGHVFKFAVAAFLSRWTFVGEGFLGAWMTADWTQSNRRMRNTALSLERLSDGSAKASGPSHFCSALRK